MTNIFSIATIISVIFLYLLSHFSVEYSSMFGFLDSTILLKKQLVYVLIGLVTFSAITQLKDRKWFHLIGAFILFFSVALLLLMLVVPESYTPTIESKKLFIYLWGKSIQPIYFFMLGSIWLVSYMYEKQTMKGTNLSIISIMIFTAFISFFTHDYAAFLLLECLLLFIIFYINGLTKFTIGSILGVTIAIAMFILSAPHRLSRLQNWLHGFNHTISKNPLNESSLQFLYSSLGGISFLVIVALFIALFYFIAKKEHLYKSSKLFSISIILLISIDLVLNILASFGYLPIHAPSLFFFSYGFSIAVVSFLIIALLSLQSSSKIVNKKTIFIISGFLFLLVGISLYIYQIPTKQESSIKLRGKIITDDNVTVASTKYFIYKSALHGEKRVYPYNDILTPVLGYNRRLVDTKTNFTYLKGVSGLEGEYNAKLQNNPLVEAEDIYLSIDFNMQKSTEKELDELKVLYDAKEIMSVIIDTDTFYVKSFASSNRYNPNSIKSKDFVNLQVHAIQYLFEVNAFANLVEDTLYLNAKNPKYQIYADLELDQASGIDLPYERVYKNKNIMSFKKYKINFMQLVKAYSPFYSGGYISNPKIGKLQHTKKKKIISQELAQKLQKKVEIFFGTMPGQPVTLEFKDYNLSAAIYMKTFSKNNHNYMQAYFTIYNPHKDKIPFKIVTHAQASVSSQYLSCTIYSKKDNHKIGTIIQPINKYQAYKRNGTESKIVGIYKGLDDQYYIDTITTKGTKIATCNACQTYNVETFQITEQNIESKGIRPFNIDNYTQYSN